MWPIDIDSYTAAIACTDDPWGARGFSPAGVRRLQIPATGQLGHIRAFAPCQRPGGFLVALNGGVHIRNHRPCSIFFPGSAALAHTLYTKCSVPTEELDSTRSSHDARLRGEWAILARDTGTDLTWQSRRGYRLNCMSPRSRRYRHPPARTAVAREGAHITVLHN